MKNNRIVTIGLVLLLSLFVIFLRVRLLTLASQNKFARVEVYNEILEKIDKKVNDRYPDFSVSKKENLIAKAHVDYLKRNKQSVEEKIRKKAQEKKAFYQNDNGHTYMFGIDSYYWLRLIDNLRHKGHIGDSIRDGQDYDDLVDEPIEKSLSRSMHLILGGFIYKVFDALKLDIDYEVGLYFIPLLFSVLLTILTFLIAKLLSHSDIAAFFAGVTINLSPLLLHRSTGEWFDTDIYNVFFPLLIFGAFLFVFKSTKTIRKSIGLLIFSLACAFYASIWQGWWHIFDLLIICGLVFIVNDYYSEGRDRALFKKNILWLSCLFISGIILVGLFNGRESFFSFISEPGKMVFALKDVPKDNWPNVFLTVAELKKISPYAIAQELGGVFIFFVAILGSIYLVLSDKKIIRDKELGIGFFCIFIWLGSLYYASLNAVRLALLLVVPLGLIFGIVFDKIIRGIFVFSQKFSKRVHLFAVGVLVLLIYIFMSYYVTGTLKIVTFKKPIINDAWYKSLTFIKGDSDKDAIINSWWDYGHWFKAVAKRPVLFDGKTQNSPVAYWMAKVITTSDEEEAVGILRMLDISKNKAFELLESYDFEHTEIINSLRDIAKLTEVEARQYLENVLDQDKINKVISLLYSSNMPKAYFITSYDIIGKMRAISLIGNWDFKRGDIWLKASDNQFFGIIKYLTEEYGYTKEEAKSLLEDLSLLSDREAPGWISRINSIMSKSISKKFKEGESLLIFDNGLTVDLSNYSAFICRGSDIDIGIPYSVVYLKDSTLKESVLEDSNMQDSVLLFKEEDKYRSILLDRDIAKSMFVRMYFLRGEGLRYFKKVFEQKTPEDNFVYTYEIEWPQ